MENKKQTVEINLMGNTYRFECTATEEEQLREAANYVNEWIKQEIPRPPGREHLMAMAILNLAHKLLDSRRQYERETKDLSDRIKKRLEQQHLQNQFEKPGVSL